MVDWMVDLTADAMAASRGVLMVGKLAVVSVKTRAVLMVALKVALKEL